MMKIRVRKIRELKSYRGVMVLLIFMYTGFSFVRAGTPVMLDSMNMFERTVLIIKYFETLHQDKGEYIGYGHRIQPSENYRFNERLSEKHSDLLLRCDILRLHRMFAEYGDASWLLTALSYNVGPYALLGSGSRPKSELIKRIEAGDHDIRELYLAYCHYMGKPHKGLLRRRLMELRFLYDIPEE